MLKGGCRDTASSMELPHRKAATTTATSYTLPRAGSGSSNTNHLGCACQQHPVRHTSRIMPTETEVVHAKAELQGPEAAPPDFGHFCFQVAAGNARGCDLRLRAEHSEPPLRCTMLSPPHVYLPSTKQAAFSQQSTSLHPVNHNTGKYCNPLCEESEEHRNCQIRASY